MFKFQLSYDFVIPVLNEEKRLPEGLPRLYNYLVSLELQNFTITIADNGSTDQTDAVAQKLLTAYPKARYLKVGQRGVGLALKKAWGESKADIVGYIDVDLATDIQHIPQMLRLFEVEQADLVNGSRNLRGSRVVNRSLVRTITSLVFNAILRAVLRVNFTDGMCGFKFLRRNVYQHLQSVGLHNDGWFFCTELLFVAEKSGMAVRELPVHWTDDRDSRVQLFRLTSYYLREIVKLRRRTIPSA